MWQIITTRNNKQSKYNFDTEKEARGCYDMFSKWNDVSGIEVIHYIRPIKPSAAPIKGSSGYRKNVFTGWKHIESSAILRNDFKVIFECYGEATIDTFCDALNGWYTTWTHWRATFTDDKGSIQITTSKKEVIDHLFETIVELGPDSDIEYSEFELARMYFEQIVSAKK